MGPAAGGAGVHRPVRLRLVGLARPSSGSARSARTDLTRSAPHELPEPHTPLAFRVLRGGSRSWDYFFAVFAVKASPPREVPQPLPCLGSEPCGQGIRAING